MEAFQADLLSASATGAPEELTVETGLRYPERAFLVNPPPVAGSIDTTPGTVSMVGFLGSDSETIDYWDGTTPRQYPSRTLSYRAEYNEYRNAPRTVYEYSTLYNVVDGETVLPTGDGKLVSGNRITLVLLEGDLSTASTRSVTTTIDPVSAPAEPTLLRTGDGSGFITITTTLSADTWANEILVDEPHVVSVTAAGPNAVTIELERRVTYQVRLAKLGIGTGYDKKQTPAYLRPLEGNGATVGPGETRRVVFAVFDEYNNPVPGVIVNATASTGGSVSPTQVRTDIDGRAVFEFTAGKTASGPVDVVGSFSDGTPANETATATITVIDGTGGGGDSDGTGGLDFNPARVGEDVILNETERNGKTVSMTLNNTIDASQSIERVRINFLFAGQPTDNDIANTFELYHEGSKVLETHPIGFDFAELDTTVTIPANDPATVLDVQFDELSSSAHDVFFVMSIVYEDEVTGERTTRVYLVPAAK
jgi:hypothetical protein